MAEPQGYPGEIVRRRITLRLDEMGMTANWVSVQAGLDRSAVSQFLNRKIDQLKDINLRAIARVLEADVRYLRGEIDTPPPSPSDLAQIVRDRIVRQSNKQNLAPSVISKRAGMDRSALGKFLKGHTTELKDSNLRAIAAVLGVEPGYLRGERKSRVETAHIQSSTLQSVQISPGSSVRRIAIIEAGAYRQASWFETMDLGVIVHGADPAFPSELQAGYGVSGDSMNLAGIVDGDDIVIVDPWQSDVELADGNLVVVERRMPGSSDHRELLVMVYHRRADAIEFQFKSTDPRYTNFTVPTDHDLKGDEAVKITGVVTGTFHRYPLRRRGDSMTVPMAAIEAAMAISEAVNNRDA